MRKTMIAGLVGAAFVGLSALGAQAFSPASAPSASPLVEQAAMGCGHGFARGPGGVCRPLGYRPRCVVRRTPHGPRRICR